MIERRKYARLNIEATVKYKIIGQRQKGAGGAAKLEAGVKILEIHNDDENRFLLKLCDRMVGKLNKEYPYTKS